MPKEFSQSERVSDAVQRELASLIRQHVRDPRVGMLSVTDVTVTATSPLPKYMLPLWVKERLTKLNRP